LSACRPLKGCPWGALFVCLLLASAPASAVVECPADRIDLRAKVEYVHDGDTVRLTDGRSVRLIGFNTPEMARDGRPAEPFAEAARDRLRGLVSGAGMRLDLRYDIDRVDRYGRTLAHAYLPDGRSVSAILIGEGLAAALTVPPNVTSWVCNMEVERQARGSGLGLWNVPRYRVRASDSLDPSQQDFILVQGRVIDLQPRRSGTRLVLEGGFVAWINRADSHYFTAWERLVGQLVEVRGWLKRRGTELQIRVRHPSALVPVEEMERARWLRGSS
jgi:endonuclease YncB( thermonuclease family)